MARNHTRSGTRPKYKWCGFGRLEVVKTAVSSTTADPIVLCPRLVDEDSQGDVTIEAVYCHLSIRRLLTSNLDACGYVMAVQKASDSSGEPLEFLNAIPTTAAGVVLGNRDLIQHGLIPVPPTLDLAGARSTNTELQTMTIEFKARRKLHRLTHGLYLHLAADVSSVVGIFASGRVLLRYS